MKNILIRADDLGYSEGVNYGIEKSVKDGLVKSIGVMTNMDATSHGVELLKKYNVCFGLHTNICVGKPLSNPKLIPSIVNKDGYFKSSKEYRNACNDFVVFEEVIIEIEAQLNKFVELFGYLPKYFEGHAVSSMNFFKALEYVANKHGLKYSGVSFDDKSIVVGKSNVYMHMGSINPNYNPKSYVIDMINNHMHDDDVDVLVCHPGYVDAYLIMNSSFLNVRALETEMLCDTTIKEIIMKNNIKEVTYENL